MAIGSRLLAIIGKRFPAIHDVIPHGPQSRFSDRFSEVALNRQPLPPHELGARIASEFVHMAFVADRLGIDPSQAFQDLDDWCPTRPRLPKLPPWWPPLPDPDPEPHPEWFADFHLGFAARIALASAGLQNTRLNGSFEKVIERSLEALGETT